MNFEKSTESKPNTVPSAESQLERLTRVSLAVLYSCEASGGFAATFIGDNIRTTMGYEPEQFVREPDFWKSHIHPEDVDTVFEGLKALFETGRHYHEYRFRHGDGTYRWMADYATLVRDAQGDPVEIVGHWIDTTYEKESFDQLHRTQEGYRQLIDTIPHGVLECDTDGRIVFSNRAHATVTGFESEELIGTHVWDRVSPEARRVAVRAYFERVVREQLRPEPFQAQVRKKDGSVVDMQVDWAARRGPEGKLQGFTSIVTDITDRKRVAEFQNHLATLVNASPDAIIRAEVDGTITSWNPAAERLYGYSAEEIIGQGITVLVPTDCLSEAEQIFKRTRNGQSAHLPETVRLTQDGRRIEISLSVFPVRNDSGTVTAVASVSHDVSEQKQLERRFHWAQRMDAIGRLAGGVAHDLNNNLTVILGQAKALGASGIDDAGPSRSRIDSILRSAEASHDLIRQLLAHARLQVGVVETVNLNRAISAMVPDIETTAGEDITLRTRFDTNLGDIEMDPDQIEQILLNLTINASDAMPSGGELTLQTENVNLEKALQFNGQPPIPLGHYVVLKVSDTGIGMDPETLAHVFEPFFTTKNPSKGPGLGLAAVYGIVKQNGGRIYAESERGIGSTFTVFLPQSETVMETSNP